MKKIKSILGGIISITVIIILIMAFSGAFDKQASELTNGAYGNDKVGSDDDIRYDSKTSETSTQNEVAEIVELSDYIDLTEDELIEKLKVDKNETGYYPNDNNINFMCIDGKVYGIMLNKIHDNADGSFSLFGIVIGDKVEENLAQSLTQKFDFVYSSTIVDGTRDVYTNKESGYLLYLDYDSEMNIFAISYVSEQAEELDGTDESEVSEDTISASESAVDSTYAKPENGITLKCTQGELFMFAYISCNEDGSLFVHLSTNSIEGEELSEYEKWELLHEGDEQDTWVSDDGYVKIKVLGESTIEVYDDTPNSAFNYYGTFTEFDEIDYDTSLN
jgi:hypothetical protein